MTSGMTSGAVTMPVNSRRPRKRPKRASTKPARVPSTVADGGRLIAATCEAEPDGVEDLHRPATARRTI